jgi:DNA-binding XRE family transcriptional regulator
MTKEELAEELGISLKTLYNWEKEKPGLVKLINLGLTVEDQIEEAERHLEKLKEMKQKATSSGKFKLK